MTDDLTLDALLTAALATYDDLAALGEDVEDEWSYVNDLAGAWRDRILQVQAGRGSELATPGVVAAVDRLAAEAAAITDPHRAIDWLSTYPQVLLVACGEQP